MVRTTDLVNEARRIANLGIGVDQDGAYGTQCVDLPNYLSSYFFGKTLWGNAIDLLNSAAALGYKVEYNIVGDLNSKPKSRCSICDGHNIYSRSFIWTYGTCN